MLWLLVSYSLNTTVPPILLEAELSNFRRSLYSSADVKLTRCSDKCADVIIFFIIIFQAKFILPYVPLEGLAVPQEYILLVCQEEPVF